MIKPTNDDLDCEFCGGSGHKDDAWRPIETAPKDKLILLAFVGELDGQPYSFSTFGWWMKGYGDGPDYMGHDDGWTDHSFSDFVPGRSFGNPQYRSKGRQPTHWMPLPKPPTKESK